ncbi:hypothetical protein ACVMII_005167 [Bradyrhizobium diazoefficiens]
MTQILILSDLHAYRPSKEHTREPSFLIASSKDNPANPIRAIPEILRQEGLSVDWILCPGDIADQADPDAQTFAWRVLGRSPISEANTSPDQKHAYSPPSGSHYVRFKALLERDVAFGQFIEDRRINLDEMHLGNENQRAGRARKYIWQVACRLAYGPLSPFTRRDSSQGERPPSRKALADIYLGYDSLLTMCEGNPRIAEQKGFTLASDQTGVVEAAIQRLITSLRRTEGPVRIAVDVSSMDRSLMARVLLTVLDGLNDGETMLVLYSPSAYIAPPKRPRVCT